MAGALVPADICELLESVGFERGRANWVGAGVPALLMEMIEKNRKALKFELEKMER
jgi:hypothetical protein